MAANNENDKPEPNKIEFDLLTVTELKSYLRNRGEYVMGKKAELVKRAIGANSLKKRPLEELRLEDENRGHQRRLERFISPLGEVLPDPISLKDGWSTDTRHIPMINNSDLYNYMVLSKRRTLDLGPNNAKRQLKAKVFYEDGHVHSVCYNDISHDNSHCYVKAKVIPSLPTQTVTQKPDYSVWICMAKVTGHVHAAGCDCSAGEGESCNHIAAFLHGLVDISDKKADASTSKECKWNQPRKRKLSPQRSQNITFKKHKWTDNKTVEKVDEKYKLENVAKKPPVTAINLGSFADKLRLCAPHAAWLLTQEDSVPRINPKVLLPPLHKIDFNFADTCDLKSDKCVNFFQSYYERLSLNQDACNKIEKMTRGQQNNKTWRVARHGRSTASNFGTVCKRRQTNEAISLIKNILDYCPFDNKIVKWGRDHESAARVKYFKSMKETYPNLIVQLCGLCVCEEYPHLGASPDGLVIIDSQVEGVIEIKCPYKWRFSTLEEAAKDSQFYCEYETGQLKLKKTHSYYYQVQAQMAITKTKWCDFILWTLKDYHKERIEFDAKFWEGCLDHVNLFYIDFILPELFSRRVKRGKPLFY
ncbi:hypothetical protein SNE40_008562 [Patella caerulea]|uniref:SWIM-type domain-containing protein n=1 Tax=Patella caerulea TaxID=87958 RepID=A0AAN8JVS6_PATCE